MMPQKILVTGATGFIGSRFCERLKLHYQQAYRALVRNFAHANRIARMGAELVGGNLLHLESIRRGLQGCDAVVHLALSGATEPRATKNLLRACREAKIKKFVHISSMAVHGPAPGPESAREETATISRYGEDYSDLKATIETLVRRAVEQEGLPAVILRPTLVYGPYGGFAWEVIQSAREGVVTLIDEGKWICNAVYVDDVCDAIAAALKSERAIGRACFVNADAAVTWREFILGFAQMVDPPPEIRSVSSEKVREYWASRQRSTLRTNISAFARLAVSKQFHDQLSTVPLFRDGIGLAKRLIRPIIPRERLRKLQSSATERHDSPSSGSEGWPNPGRLVRETYAVAFSNTLAKDVLDWQPRYDFRAGSELTRTWLSFARQLSANDAIGGK